MKKILDETKDFLIEKLKEIVGEGEINTEMISRTYSRNKSIFPEKIYYFDGELYVRYYESLEEITNSFNRIEDNICNFDLDELCYIVSCIPEDNINQMKYNDLLIKYNEALEREKKAKQIINELRSKING